MIRIVISIWIICYGSFSLWGQTCTKEKLASAVESYLNSQRAGDPTQMKLGAGVIYSENMKVKPMEKGIINQPLHISFARSIYDVDECRSFSEIIVAQSDHAYVLGVRLTLNKDKIKKIDAIVTDEGDWKFDAESYQKNSSGEDWSTLSQKSRISRQVLIDAANKYMDRFTFQDTKVPWGIPCARLEGGYYTGDGPRSSCKVGIPGEAIEIVDRDYLVDEELGAVNVFSRFGKTDESSIFGKTNGLPDSHLIRLVNGKIRYIHSMTAVE
jgi:hypothetical protein